MRNYIIISICLSLFVINAKAQNFIDTSFQFQTVIKEYDSAINFAGKKIPLKLNISYPTNDNPKPCGRPLLVAIHGGAFLGGTKDDQLPIYIQEKFAKRGYVTASLDYRLGQFQTSSYINCNVTYLGLNWNCLNMADTAEWYRANYRAMLDAKSAIRYLVNHANDYKIDPRNIFVVGESAGGFVALATAFLDNPLEKPIPCNTINAVLAPNALYENLCIQTPQFATNISTMDLTRLDLGSIDGISNPTTTPYQIKGVGNFYGGMLFDNLFLKSNYTQAPAIYFYHQPNDLVVPYDRDKLLAGLAYCYTQWPANCQWIINRPFVNGSKGIKKMIDSLTINPNLIPEYYFDSTANYADCATQISTPYLTGHSVDNIGLRTSNMATFFASKIDTTCIPQNIQTINNNTSFIISPNPCNHSFKIVSENKTIDELKIYTINGSLLFQKKHFYTTETIETPTLLNGLYILEINNKSIKQYAKLIISK